MMTKHPQAPKKGDLVVGHQVYAFMPNGLPAVPAKATHIMVLYENPFAPIDGQPSRAWQMFAL